MAARRPQKTPAIPAPSSSVVVISPDNEVLLLHRVQTAGSFSSAHVFPGGNLSRFHEGELVPYVDSPARHVDGEAYRLAAIRETFEESGVLLAKRADGTEARSLLQLHPDDIDSGRLAVANERVRFEEWLGQVGGVPDLENLIPFTRWLTPPNLQRRYTTQMYLYMMPLADVDAPPPYVPTADNTEVMAAEFAPAAEWVDRAQRNEVILFPPQMYLLSLLAPFLASTPGPVDQETLSTERRRLAELVRDGRAPDEDARTFVPWADRVISPQMAGRIRTADGQDRTVMVLDSPGPELRGKRGGDSYRAIVLSNMPPGPPRDIQVRRRAEVLPLLREKEKL